jgi:hypothetical protein
MPKFVFSYRVPQDYRPGTETGKAWQAWFDGLGASQIEQGNAVAATRKLGNLGDGTRLGGYSMVAAEDMQAAVALADGCPAIQLGGGVEIGAVPEFAADAGGDTDASGPPRQTRTVTVCDDVAAVSGIRSGDG